MKGILVWGDKPECQRIVSSLDELNSIIDNLTHVATKDMPFTVELSVTDKTNMNIVLGLDISSVTYYSENETPQYYGSRGDYEGDEWVSFLYKDHFSEKPKAHFVSIQEAREALRIYFRTGMRPRNIAWISASI